MLSIRKTALAVIALGVSGVATAGMYTPAPAPVATCNNGVTVPCEQNAWDLGVQALYVQPNNIEDVTDVVSGTLVNSVTDAQDLQPKWNWGFRIEGSYHFHTGNDFNVNWTHFKKGTSQTDGGTTGSVAANYLAGTSFNEVDTSVEEKFDQVNFELGQLVNFGENVSARFHAGVSYLRISQDVDQFGTDFVGNGSVAAGAGIDQNSKYSGWGPRVGTDLAYNCGNGFAIVGSAAASLYVGNRDFDADSSAFVTGIGSATSSIDSSSRVIVPGAEAKLGLQYDHPMAAHGDLALQAGYQVNNYWNSVQRFDTNVLADQDTNFAYQGVYLGLKWVGNV